MGGQLSTDTAGSGVPHDPSLVATGKMVRTSMGDFLELRNGKGQSMLKMTVVFEGTKNVEAIKRGISEVEKAKKRNPQLHFLWVYSYQFFENQLYCASSNVTIIFDHFTSNLEDLCEAGQIKTVLGKESDFWGFLVSLVKVLRFSAHNGFKGGFVHPRTICWSPERNGFYLMHPCFLNSSNLSLAKAGSLHFSSPELFAFAQKTEVDATVDVGKSDMFSLGLVVIHLLTQSTKLLKTEALFNRFTGQFEAAHLDVALAGLAKGGLSKLLLAVLQDMTTEFDYLRISPDAFLDFFEGRETVLKDPTFKEHPAVLDQYLFSKNARVVESNGRNGERRRS